MSGTLKLPAVIFDMDGTLCDIEPIKHLVSQGLKSKNFSEFHKRSADMDPIEWVVNEARSWHEVGANVIIVTARQHLFRTSTVDWLHQHGVPFTELHMRRDGDVRDDVDIKKDILHDLKNTYRVLWAFDDRPDVVALWQTHHIPVTVVPGWVDEVSLTS
jgi:phosphoglycolate phosphatase-like HAD superfamily hydrolase